MAQTVQSVSNELAREVCRLVGIDASDVDVRQVQLSVGIDRQPEVSVTMLIRDANGVALAGGPRTFRWKMIEE